MDRRKKFGNNFENFVAGRDFVETGGWGGELIRKIKRPSTAIISKKKEEKGRGGVEKMARYRGAFIPSGFLRGSSSIGSPRKI